MHQFIQHQISICNLNQLLMQVTQLLGLLYYKKILIIQVIPFFDILTRYYSTISLIFGFQHFEVHVTCHVAPIIFFSDHNPPTFIHKMKNKSKLIESVSIPRTKCTSVKRICTSLKNMEQFTLFYAPCSRKYSIITCNIILNTITFLDNECQKSVSMFLHTD